MSRTKPPSLLHGLAAIAIVILSAVFGLKHNRETKPQVENYQQLYLPPSVDGANRQDWPAVVFGQRIEAVYAARVIRIVDGDTVELLLANSAHPNVRLASIDAPERGQPFGSTATEVLKPYVGQLVTVLQTEIDRYNRPVAFVIDDQGLNVNVAMVQAGYAWHYAKYSSDPILQELQRKAQIQRLGLWQNQQPIAPEQWRQLSKNSTSMVR